MHLPAELKLRVVELADIDSIENLARTCRTMWSLWTENSQVVWNVILKERYKLESKVIGPADSFPSFAELAGRKEWCPKWPRTREQEATIESAAQAVVMRSDIPVMHGGTFCCAPMVQLSTEARKGGFGYLRLLDEISRCVDADMESVKEDLVGVGLTDLESFRSAVLLLWRMRWWKIENVPDPTSFLIMRKRYRVLDDDERVQLVAKETVKGKKKLRLFLETLAWKLGRSFGVNRICHSAIIDERLLEEQDGQDRHIPQLQALLWTEMEGWLMREVIERGLHSIVSQVRDPYPDLATAAHEFCWKKVTFLKSPSLRETITDKGVWIERQTDLVSRFNEIMDEGKTAVARAMEWWSPEA